MTDNKYNPNTKDPRLVKVFSNPEPVPFAFGANQYKGMREQVKATGRGMKRFLKRALGRRATPEELKAADMMFRARAEELSKTDETQRPKGE